MNIAPWREASRPLSIFGIPAGLWLIYFAWFRWPCFRTLAICTVILLFFKGLSIFGYTFTVFIHRAIHLLRGSPVLGRPWWVRKFFE